MATIVIRGHQYDVTRHRASEGMVLCQQILALVVEPIAAGLGPVVVAGIEAGGIKAALGRPEVLAAIDFAALSRGVKASLLSLPPSVVLGVLRYTNRDGKPLVANDGRATEDFDKAFAGNYLELGAALWEVSIYNGFFPELGTFVSEVSAKLAAAAATPATPA